MKRKSGKPTSLEHKVDTEATAMELE